MNLATAVATRSTCLRRAVGCVLINDRHRIIATGYNGVTAGQPHCNWVLEMPMFYDGPGYMGEVDRHPHACPGATEPSGQGLDKCAAIHAEQNALVWCREPDAIYTAYVTTEPCVSCTKLLLGTPCHRIVYGERYASGGIELWQAAGREALLYG